MDIKKIEGRALDAAKRENAPRSYMEAGNTIGKYVGQEALFAPKSAMKKATIGPNASGASSGYSGLTSIY